jgi:hypothetical protein
LLLAVLIAAMACTPAPKRPSESLPAEALSAARDAAYAWYDGAHDGTVYVVKSDESRLEIRTGRTGPLMRLGHNHVITSNRLEGLVFVANDRSQSRADMSVAVESFVVDEPAARAAAGAGFESVPTAADIAGTRANMMGPALLDAARFPRIDARIKPLDVAGGRASVNASFTVLGVAHEVQVPAEWRVEGRRLRVSCIFDVTHGGLGLEPFSAVGGALRVADEIGVRVEVVAVARS